MKPCGFHQRFEEPRIHHTGEKSGTWAEVEVDGILPCGNACGDCPDALAGHAEFFVDKWLRVGVHEWHADVASGHDDGVYSANHAFLSGYELSPLAVDVSGFRAACTDHVDELSCEVCGLDVTDNYGRHAPGIDGKDPNGVGEVRREQFGELSGDVGAVSKG